MAEEKKYLGQSGIATLRDWVKGNFVGQVEGKGLSTNDLTDELKAKIEAAAAAADVQALEELIGTLPEGTSAQTVIAYIDAKTANIASDEALAQLAQRVTDVEGSMATDDELAAAKTELEGKITAATADMATNASVAEAIKDFATDTEVSDAIAAATTDMATNAGVDEKIKDMATDQELADAVAGIEAKGYQNADQVAAAVTAGTEGMATQTWVGEQGYATTASVNEAIKDMATDAEVEAAVAGLASEEWVEGKGYDTASSVDGKVSAAKSELNQAIATATTDMATNAGVDEKIGAAIASTYKAAGSSAFASLPALSADIEGHVYNVTDSFVTTADFVEGANNSYPMGTNVVCIEVDGGYKWDVLPGFVDLSSYAKSADIVEYSAAEITAILNA